MVLLFFPIPHSIYNSPTGDANTFIKCLETLLLDQPAPLSEIEFALELLYIHSLLHLLH